MSALVVCAMNPQGATSVSAAVKQWSRIGLNGGSILTIVPNPVTLTTLYVSTDGGGVFKTTDGGMTWAVLDNGLPKYFVRALAVAPSNASPCTYSGRSSSTPRSLAMTWRAHGQCCAPCTTRAMYITSLRTVYTTT